VPDDVFTTADLATVEFDPDVRAAILARPKTAASPPGRVLDADSALARLLARR
jgi:hypothetical protein